MPIPMRVAVPVPVAVIYSALDPGADTDVIHHTDPAPAPAPAPAHVPVPGGSGFDDPVPDDDPTL